jgi:hypothetical protein
VIENSGNDIRGYPNSIFWLLTLYGAPSWAMVKEVVSKSNSPDHLGSENFPLAAKFPCMLPEEFFSVPAENHCRV